MVSQRTIESIVGLFLLLAVMCFTMLAFKVSGLTTLFPQPSYIVKAEFDDIGGLKVRAPIKIGGVQVGEVTNITLDHKNFKALVSMRIFNKFNAIPDDSSAGIYTSGLLGDNYIAITPMYSEHMLQNGGTIEFTRSAMVLEKLIGQFIYKMNNNTNDNGGGSNVKK